jgi:hypothetical protein
VRTDGCIVIGIWLSNSSMMTQYTLFQRLVRIWRDFNEKPSWKYRELAPTALLSSWNLHESDVDSSELSRAEWFWRRRLRLILGEGFFGWVLVSLTASILFSLPISFVWLEILDTFVGLGLALGWILAGYFAIAIDTARLVHWRRKCEASVDRLTRTPHETS